MHAGNFERKIFSTEIWKAIFIKNQVLYASLIIEKNIQSDRLSILKYFIH